MADPAVETPVETTPAEGASDTSAPANGWHALRAGLSTMFGTDEDAAPVPVADDADDEAEAREDASDRTRGSTPEATNPEATTGTGEKPAGAKPASAADTPEGAKDSAKPPRYHVRGTDGATYEVELPEGAQITFKAGKRDVVVESMDDLVAYAQKGADYDRQGQELGSRAQRAEAQLVTQEREHSEALTQRDTLIEQSEELLLRAVFDDAARAKLAEQLEDYRDPRVRAGLAATAREEARAADEAARREQERHATLEQTEQRFWEATATELASNVLPAMSHLDETDIPVIQQQYLAAYERVLAASATEALALAPARGWTEQQALQVAQQHALGFHTEENLRAVAASLNTDYARRFESKKARADSAATGTPATAAPAAKGAAPGTPADPAADAQARERAGREAAEQHNARVTAQLAKRDAPRMIRGGGSAPAGAPAPVDTSRMTFAEKMKAMKAELHKA